MEDENAPPTPAEEAAARAGVLRTAEAWAEAIVSNDAERIAVYMADEWTIVSGTGVTAKDDFLAHVASGDLTHSAMAPVGEPRILLAGGTAVSTARVVNTAYYRGTRHDADEWTTDIFVRRRGRWVCVHTHITPANEAPG
ncbi:nuclear transport factor 2 family protein [Nocardiopsis chromatogenes]|uniref:nuclear transport factor 2 family protein n=1 Tax=Nocardiopsis chromatogenes TaxID=280239 RepID=UPI000346122D|nr:nuclear transport factor 2 family protein [Nocardiopsis chromatogenes]